jgi:Domain of unknown function (DUF4399)
MKRILVAAALAGAPLLAMMQSAHAQQSAVSFVEPVDGAIVRNPFAVKLDIVGKEVTKAGADVPNAGHYVLIVDGGPVPEGQAVPADATHIHWKNGKTEDKVRLPAGTHRLTAQFVNGERQSYGVALSRTITVTVK